MEDKCYKLLIKLARKAIRKGEIPVSALIVYNNKILASAYNKRKRSHLAISHAEVLVINKASRKLKDWRLAECDLYVTLKPCSMCESIIKQARIRNVYYLVDKPNEKREYYKTNFTKANTGTQEEEYSQELKDFFQKKRDKNRVSMV
ncbi:MAG: nucleoside deaminase [Firmicutes bacterium]|nr:nucleoside deaminase [Bacillota bacterium]